MPFVYIGTMNFPDPIPMPGTNTPFNYFFIGDAAFPLKETLLKPYSRLSLPDDNIRNISTTNYRRLAVTLKILLGY